MPVYIGKSGDLVGCYRSLTHWQTTEYSATQLVSSIKHKLSHAICMIVAENQHQNNIGTQKMLKIEVQIVHQAHKHSLKLKILSVFHQASGVFCKDILFMIGHQWFFIWSYKTTSCSKLKKICVFIFQSGTQGRACATEVGLIWQSEAWGTSLGISSPNDEQLVLNQTGQGSLFYIPLLSDLLDQAGNTILPKINSCGAMLSNAFRFYSLLRWSRDAKVLSI